MWEKQRELNRHLRSIISTCPNGCWHLIDPSATNLLMRLTHEVAAAQLVPFDEAIRKAAADEREACAVIADNYYVSSVAGSIANQIRARAKGGAV